MGEGAQTTVTSNSTSQHSTAPAGDAGLSIVGAQDGLLSADGTGVIRAIAPSVGMLRQRETPRLHALQARADEARPDLGSSRELLRNPRREASGLAVVRIPVVRRAVGGWR